MSKPMAPSAWLSTLSMSALFLFLALSLGSLGCRGHHEATADAGTISVPVRLTVTPSRPSGTLDSLPDLTWALSGEAGLSLVVRAQGPGNAGVGEGFAGVRPATGPVLYLAANGQWGATEVAYAATAGASGTIQLSPPLRLEGAWWFILMAKNASGELQALAETQVVLSGAPLVQVTLSRSRALAGDSVSGSVTLTRGATARPVRLIAYWKAPDGTAERLPGAGTLAYDGPSADLSLPLLRTRMDNAAPGPWSLVARLFDTATGAPIGYGEQTLQVYSDVTILSGGVFGSDGAPLGTGASFAQVHAVALDRSDSVSTPIDPTGAFSVALRPGAWMVSAMVIDAGGMHLASERFVPVGGAMAPIALHAAAPVAVDTSVLPSSKVAGAPAARVLPQAAATDCKITDRVLRMRLACAIDPAASALIGGPGRTSQIEDQIKADVTLHTKGGLLIQLLDEIKGMANTFAMEQALGEDPAPGVTLGAKGLAFYEALSAALGAQTFMFLGIEKRQSFPPDPALPPPDPTLDITLNVVDPALNWGKGGLALPRVSKVLVQANWDAALAAIRALTLEIKPDMVATYARDHSNRPTEPNVNLPSTFGSTDPYTLHLLTVHLEDCDKSVYAGRLIDLVKSPVPFPRWVSEMTDANGDARFAVDLGIDLGIAGSSETLVASYSSPLHGKPTNSQPFKYAVQRGQSGQVQFGPVVPVIHPGGSLVLSVTSRDPVTGVPQPLKPIAIQSDLGGLQQGASGTTDANGEVSTPVAAGNTVGLGKADAYLTTAPPIKVRLTPQGGAAIPLAEPPNTGHASEYLVVSSPVALNFSGPTGQVLPGAVVPLTGSLTLEGLPLVGQAITLTLAGGGILSAGNLSASDTGHFEATFQPPPDGTGSATVTASTLVEGQTVTKDVLITWAGSLPPPIAFTRSAGGAVQIFTVNPAGTNLTQLTFSTNHSQAPAWSPDHKKIAFTRMSEIIVMNADGTDPVQITNHSRVTQGSYYPTWSPDGLRIAYHEAVGAVVPGGPSLDGLSIVNADGSNNTTLTSGGDAIDDNYPSWSPDGTAIAFNGYRKGNGNVRGVIVHTLATNAETILTPPGVLGNYPAWSPSGAQVAYSFNTNNLMRVNADGSGTTQINTGTGTYTWPRWSPDGSKIVAQGTLNGVAGIYIMNLDGSNPTLVPNTENGSAPSW